MSITSSHNLSLRHLYLPQVCKRYHTTSASSSSSVSVSASAFQELATRNTSTHQIYLSSSTNPFVNLSIEHFLFEKSPASSSILFLYINRSCVVIGRNQNPWLEVNLQHLLHQRPACSSNSAIIDLVRRRSGGGTVFHDEGNVNFSVICPPADFHRDKHAEMVARAIGRDGITATVNERHDIILDSTMTPLSQQGERSKELPSGSEKSSRLKVSGSAYKLARHRSLHHGTCLVRSPNIKHISDYLRSPASWYIKARGVDSVRSPVGNAYSEDFPDAIYRFQSNVLKEFASLHGVEPRPVHDFFDQRKICAIEDLGSSVCGYLDESVVQIDSIKEGMQQLQSPEWIYHQTPSFVFSSKATEEDPRPRPVLPSELAESTSVLMTVKSGKIESTVITLASDPATASEESANFDTELKGLALHEIRDFSTILSDSSLGSWLNSMFGKRSS